MASRVPLATELLLGSRRWRWSRPRCWGLPAWSSGRRRRGGSGRGRCCRCRGGGCRRRTSSLLAEDFHGGNWCGTAIIAAGEPDVVGAVGISGEVAPRVNERRAKRPNTAHRIIDIYFVGDQIKRAAHHPHVAVEIQPTRVACRSRYACNRLDRVSYGIKAKRSSIILKRSAVPGGAATGVDKVTDCRSWHIGEGHTQMRVFQRPRVRCRSKFIDRVNHAGVDLKPAEDIQLVVEHGKTTGQSYPIRVSRPGRSNSTNSIGDRVIAKDAIGSPGLSRCRPAPPI